MEIGVRREPCAPGGSLVHAFREFRAKPWWWIFFPTACCKKSAGWSPRFLGAFVFDKWTCNCDGRQMIFARSDGNERAAYSAWLIDHGFCFNDGEWNFPDSAIRSLYPRRLVYEKVRGLQSFEPYLSGIENLEREAD